MAPRGRKPKANARVSASSSANTTGHEARPAGETQGTVRSRAPAARPRRPSKPPSLEECRQQILKMQADLDEKRANFDVVVTGLRGTMQEVLEVMNKASEERQQADEALATRAVVAGNFDREVGGVIRGVLHTTDPRADSDNHARNSQASAIANTRDTGPSAAGNRAKRAQSNAASEREVAAVAEPAPLTRRPPPVARSTTKKRSSSTKRKSLLVKVGEALANMAGDVEMRDQSGNESDAVEALVQLSQDPVVLERNQGGTRDSHDNQATVPQFQPEPLFESDDTMEMEVERNQTQDPLQAWLYRQQSWAGIPPDQMISMTDNPTQGRGPGPVNSPENPSVVQFTAAGTILAPSIPPARFEGVLRTLPFESETPSFSNELPQNEQSAAEALALNEEIYGSEGRPDRHAGTSERGIPTQGPQARIAVSRSNTAARTPDNQHRDRMRPRRILPRLFLGPPDRRSPSTIAPIQLSQNYQPNVPHQPHNGFDILQAFTDHPLMGLQLIGFLEPNDLVNLHACSKNWDTFTKAYPEIIVRKQSKQQAPESERIFPFNCYPKLCKPKYTQESENELVPDYPWLLMIMNRERIVRSIIEWMQRMGYELPAGASLAIKKLWFLMDIPDTKRRLWTVKNEELWSDMDLFLAGLFMIHVDSALLAEDQDDNGDSIGAPRRLLMAQKSLSVLWDVLRGAIWQSELEVVQSFIRWHYEPRPHERGMSTILGVPIQQVGLLQYESYGDHGRNNKLRRPDSLILRELKRRTIDIPKLYQETLTLEEVVPRDGDQPRQWDEVLRETIEGSGLDWRDAVNLDHPKIS